MPNRILRKEIPTSERVNLLDCEQEVFYERAMLPRVKAGDPIQSIKHRLSTRLRRLRMHRAGKLDAKLASRMIGEAGDICACCGNDMRYWVSRRHPTIDHIVPLAKGGTNDPKNLRVICNRCNSRKADA